MDDKTFWLDQRRKIFEASLEMRFNRAQKVQVLNVIPGKFFSRASTECREMFIDGHFVGCISLCQAVAEGLSKFLAKVKIVKKSKDYRTMYTRLHSDKIISKETLDAFLKIRGTDRDDFHHMNENIMEDYQQLEQRAEECLSNLFIIEAEIFDHRFEAGKLIPKHPEYWSINNSTGTANVFLRQHF